MVSIRGFPSTSFGQSLVFFLLHHFRQRLADFFKARKIPEIRKIAALLRLDRLDRAVISIQKNTFAIGLIVQRESAPVVRQTCELLDEIRFAQILELRQTRDFHIG